MNNRTYKQYTLIVRSLTKDGEIRTDLIDSRDLSDASDPSERELISIACERTAGYARTKRVLSAEIHPSTENEMKMFEGKREARELNRKKEFFRNFNRTADTEEIRENLMKASPSFSRLRMQTDALLKEAEEKNPGCGLYEKTEELLKYYATYAAVFPVGLVRNRREEPEKKAEDMQDAVPEQNS